MSYGVFLCMILDLCGFSASSIYDTFGEGAVQVEDRSDHQYLHFMHIPLSFEIKRPPPFGEEPYARLVDVGFRPSFYQNKRETKVQNLLSGSWTCFDFAVDFDWLPNINCYSYGIELNHDFGLIVLPPVGFEFSTQLKQVDDHYLLRFVEPLRHGNNKPKSQYLMDLLQFQIRAICERIAITTLFTPKGFRCSLWIKKIEVCNVTQAP